MKIRTRVLISLLCCIVIFALLPIACSSGGGTINATPFQSGRGLVEKLTLDDLAVRANLVVLGEVSGVASHKEANGNIYTLVTFSVVQTLKGETTNEVVVSVPGGKYDGLVQVVEDAPSFQLGERAMVFLQKGDGIFRVIGGFQGKFTIDKNNMVDNAPLQQFVEQVRNDIDKP